MLWFRRRSERAPTAHADVDATRNPDLARKQSELAIAEAEDLQRQINQNLARSTDPATRSIGMTALGEAALEAGDVAGATDLFQRVVEDGDPWSAPIGMLRLAQVAERRGELADAAQWLDRATATHHPEATPAAWLELAELIEPFNGAAASDAIRDAEMALRDTIEWASQQQSSAADAIGRDAQLQLAELQDRQGRHAQAAELLGPLISRGQSDSIARRARQMLVRIDPDWVARERPTEPPALPREARPAQRLAHDASTDVDQLDRARYADALGDFLFDDETRAPLAIGIYGPWGSGKTSLMRMLRRRVDPRSSLIEQAVVDPSPADAVLSTRDAIRRILRRRGTDVSLTPVRSPASRHTVWFNPWMYQSRHEVWAGLARELIVQSVERMPRRDQELFWLELNLRRARYDRVRTRLHRWLIERLVPSAAIALAVTLAGGFLALLDVLQPVVGVVGGLVAGVGAASVVAVVHVSRRLAAPSEGLFKDLVEAPDYSPSSSSYAAVVEDVQRVVGLVATPIQPLVVFIDDLDRCDSGTVAEVIEAINLFLGGPIENCIFVLGMDPRIIAATLETAYADLEKSDELVRHVSAPSVGWRFLDKVVQVPLRLPTVPSAEVDAYVASLLAQASGPAVRPEPVLARPDLVEGLGQVLAHERPRRLESGIKILRKEQETIIEFRDDSPQTAAIIRRHARFFRGNPREIKRFLNVFRVFASLAVRRELHGGQRDNGDSHELEALARLAVLSVRWPHLVDVLLREIEVDGRTRSVLGVLEDSSITLQDKRGQLEPWLTGRDVGALTAVDGLSVLLDGAPRLEPIAPYYL